MGLPLVMRDVLFPATDAGVAAQVMFVVMASVTVGWLVRRNRDALLLVIGIFVMTMALFGLRALH